MNAATTEATEGEGEGEGEQTEIQPEIRANVIFSLSYKTESGNISVKIDENGVVKTNNTREQILQAIEFLNNSI